MLNIITITKDDFDGFRSTLECVKVFREKYGATQIVVDSSKDDVAHAIKELCKSETNIEYYWTIPKGTGAGFNAGIPHCKAEWIWFLNGGDVTHPDLEPSLLFMLMAKSDADVIKFDSEFTTSRKPWWRLPPIWFVGTMLPFYINHQACLMRRRVFEKYGVFDTSYRVATDTELFLRLSLDFVRFDIISIPIALYQEGGLSDRERDLSAVEVRKILHKYTLLLIRRWMSSTKSMIKNYFFYK